MRMLVAKSGEKRLDGSVPLGVDQSKIRITPAANAGILAQFVRQRSQPRHNVSQRLDRGAKRQHLRTEGVLLGDVGLDLE